MVTKVCSLIINHLNFLIESTLQGISLLKSHPQGFPEVILPQPIPVEDYQDVPTLSTLPPESKAWWEHFGDNQFPEGYGLPSDDIYEDPWVEQQVSAESSEDQISHEESSYRSIHIVNQQPALWATLEVGCLVAVRPSETYEPVEGEIRERFWIGDVVSISPNTHTFTINYYSLTNNNSYVPWDFEAIEQSMESILLANFELTKYKKLKKADERKILSVL